MASEEDKEKWAGYRPRSDRMSILIPPEMDEDTKNDIRAFIMIGGEPDDWGLILSFLDFDDPHTAIEQFDAKYISGWCKFEGFSWDKVTGNLSYPGDPPYRPTSAVIFRDEIVVLYPSAWVLVTNRFDQSKWQVARMD